MKALSFGEMVRRYRIMRGLTQDQLAERAGTDGSYISRLERDVEKAPGHDMAQRLIGALEVTDSEDFVRALGYPLNPSIRADLERAVIDSDLRDETKEAFLTLLRLARAERAD